MTRFEIYDRYGHYQGYIRSDDPPDCSDTLPPTPEEIEEQKRWELKTRRQRERYEIGEYVSAGASLGVIVLILAFIIECSVKGAPGYQYFFAIVLGFAGCIPGAIIGLVVGGIRVSAKNKP